MDHNNFKINIELIENQMVKRMLSLIFEEFCKGHNGIYASQFSLEYFNMNNVNEVKSFLQKFGLDIEILYEKDKNQLIPVRLRFV